MQLMEFFSKNKSRRFESKNSFIIHTVECLQASWENECIKFLVKPFVREKFCNVRGEKYKGKDRKVHDDEIFSGGFIEFWI